METNLLNFNDYSHPGDYREDAWERGFGVSVQFCLAVSKIMDKYKLIFPNACNFLEENGFLIWADDIPIYNIAGDVLWRDREQERIDREKAARVPEKKQQSV